ncbi:hypothetical protein GQ53DRAFT_834056 [Thozetella sp. PMI_491]|nr:hypothetical protein GQ53DRAFT_834056 [Thozetella sp. PMI_491]
MGCSDNTQNLILQVGTALVSTLLNEAASMLEAAVEDPSDIQTYYKSKMLIGDPPDAQKMAQLQTDLQNISRQNFLKLFAYSYNGDSSYPTDFSPSPKALCKSHEDFVSAKEGDTTTITNYVDNTILGGGGGAFPDWFHRPFSNDLLSTMTTIAQAGNPNWQIEKFEQTYKDPSGQMLDIACNAVMVYCNAQLTEDGQTATKTIIYYLGLYYNSVGWSLQNTISDALLGKPVNVTYPIIQYSIATGTLIVATAIAAYILRAPPPQAGVLFKGPFGLSLTLILFRRGPSSVAAQGPRPRAVDGDDTSNAGNTTGLLSAQTGDIDVTWLEKILNARSLQFTKSSGMSDTDTTAEIALLQSYN